LELSADRRQATGELYLLVEGVNERSHYVHLGPAAEITDIPGQAIVRVLSTDRSIGRSPRRAPPGSTGNWSRARRHRWFQGAKWTRRGSAGCSIWSITARRGGAVNSASCRGDRKWNEWWARNWRDNA